MVCRERHGIGSDCKEAVVALEYCILRENVSESICYHVFNHIWSSLLLKYIASRLEEIMIKIITVLTVCLVAIATVSFAGKPHPITTQSPALRNWMASLSERIEGWALYTDGASVCILKKGGATTTQKINRFSNADQSYLGSNPPPTKDLFEPEEERNSLVKEIEELSGRLSSLEASRKSGKFHGTVDNDSGDMATYSGTYSEGASKAQIKALSAVIGERSAKLSALKLAFK